MNQTPISFNVGFKDHNISLYLRMISLQEEDDLIKRFADIQENDSDRIQKEFEIKVNAIAEWSLEMPTRRIEVDGVTSELPIDGEFGSAYDCVKAFFGDRSTENDRIAEKAIVVLRNSCIPLVTFL